MAYVSIGVYVVGIPLLFGGLLWYNRKEAHMPKVQYWLGNLYYCYKPQFFWYEMVMIFRRLTLAVLISFISENNSWRVSAIFCILLLSLFIQYWVKPFRTQKDNLMEELALITILLTFGCQTSWKNKQLQDSQEDEKVYAGSLFFGANSSDPNNNSDSFSNTTQTVLVLLTLVLNLIMLLTMVVVIVLPLAQTVWWAAKKKLRAERKKSRGSRRFSLKRPNEWTLVPSVQQIDQDS